jgi:hypothetical protein
MEVFAIPSALANIEAELIEAALQGFAFATPAAGGRILAGKLGQIVADQAGEGGVMVDCNLADAFDKFLVQGQSDVHKPIIRDSLILCKTTSPDVGHLHVARLQQTC